MATAHGAVANRLTEKQSRFCNCYIEIGNATEAYRRCYDAGAMAPATVNRKAKELLDNGKISARLAELREPAVKNARASLEEHLQSLARLRDRAEAAEKFGPAVQAEIARGRASGLYVEKVQNIPSDHAWEQILADTHRFLQEQDSAGPVARDPVINLEGSEASSSGGSVAR